MNPSPEETLLRNLPSHDVDPVLAERLRRRAHAAVLQRVAERVAPPHAPGWPGYYHRFVEPSALLALGFGYLVSSFQATIALLQ